MRCNFNHFPRSFLGLYENPVMYGTNVSPFKAVSGTWCFSIFFIYWRSARLSPVVPGVVQRYRSMYKIGNIYGRTIYCQISIRIHDMFQTLVQLGSLHIWFSPVWSNPPPLPPSFPPALDSLISHFSFSPSCCGEDRALNETFHWASMLHLCVNASGKNASALAITIKKTHLNKRWSEPTCGQAVPYVRGA